MTDTSSEEDFDLLPQSLSINRIDDLLEQMRFYESPKRALFSIPFELGGDLVIGIKGYGLVTEQKRGAYKYFVDLGDRMEVVESRTSYVDEVRTPQPRCLRLSHPDHDIQEQEAEVERSGVQFGMTLGATGDDEGTEENGFGTRAVGTGRRVSIILLTIHPSSVS